MRLVKFRNRAKLKLLSCEKALRKLNNVALICIVYPVAHSNVNKNIVKLISLFESVLFVNISMYNNNCRVDDIL